MTMARPRADDETVKWLWSDCDLPGHMMQVALWIKEKNEGTGEWESTFWKEQLQVWRDEEELRAELRAGRNRRRSARSPRSDPVDGGKSPSA